MKYLMILLALLITPMLTIAMTEERAHKELIRAAQEQRFFNSEQNFKKHARHKKYNEESDYYRRLALCSAAQKKLTEKLDLFFQCAQDTLTSEERIYLELRCLHKEAEENEFLYIDTFLTDQTHCIMANNLKGVEELSDIEIVLLLKNRPLFKKSHASYHDREIFFYKYLDRLYQERSKITREKDLTRMRQKVLPTYSDDEDDEQDNYLTEHEKPSPDFTIDTQDLDNQLTPDQSTSTAQSSPSLTPFDEVVRTIFFEQCSSETLTTTYLTVMPTEEIPHDDDEGEFVPRLPE